jgi:hypothetical protein
MNNVCHGNGADHCCTIKGWDCVFLKENFVEGRRWACLLYVEIEPSIDPTLKGKERHEAVWEAVHKSERYLKIIRPRLDASGAGIDCGDWPQNDPLAVGDYCCYKNLRQ